MEQDQKKKLYKLGLPIILGTILLIGVSYAWFTLTLNGTKTNVLKAGTLSLTLTDTTSSGINLTGAVPMYDEVGKVQTPYKFTLTNNGTIPSEYTIYLDDVALLTGETKLPDSAIKYNLVKDGVTVATELLSETGTNPNRILETGVIQPGTSNAYTYELRLWLDEDATISQANKTFRGKIRVVASQKVQSRYNNENIVAAYAYQETDTATKCISGEESTCQITTEYEPGTIVKYKVNASETKYFYVLHDDGDTLTMQQRENTTTAAWNNQSSATAAAGPITAITALEAATSSWTNVNDQTYTMGTTVFGSFPDSYGVLQSNNAYTGCSDTGCTTNTYTWAARTGKARMITAQEALGQGCQSLYYYSLSTCPDYMVNYLKNSQGYGGTINVSTATYSYWLMSASSSGTTKAKIIATVGSDSGTIASTSVGVRAVVVIDK